MSPLTCNTHKNILTEEKKEGMYCICTGAKPSTFILTISVVIIFVPMFQVVKIHDSHILIKALAAKKMCNICTF